MTLLQELNYYYLKIDSDLYSLKIKVHLLWENKKKLSFYFILNFKIRGNFKFYMLNKKKFEKHQISTIYFQKFLNTDIWIFLINSKNLNIFSVLLKKCRNNLSFFDFSLNFTNSLICGNPELIQKINKKSK